MDDSTRTRPWRTRPWWMNALLVLCLANVFLVVPWTVFLRPTAEVVNVWFGFEVRGSAGRLTALAHGVVYAIGAWGFWKVRPWVRPLAVLYLVQVAVGHVVWSETSPNGRGWPIGMLQAAAFLAAAVAMWRARDVFAGPPTGRAGVSAGVGR